MQQLGLIRYFFKPTYMFKWQNELNDDNFHRFISKTGDNKVISCICVSFWRLYFFFSIYVLSHTETCKWNIIKTRWSGLKTGLGRLIFVLYYKFFFLVFLVYVVDTHKYVCLCLLYKINCKFNTKIPFNIFILIWKTLNYHIICGI